GGWVEQGIPRVKMKVGREPAADRARALSARKAVGDDVELMVDANGAYALKQALAFARDYAELGVTWFEEPVSSDDLDGLRFLRERAPSPIEIAAGEYAWDPWCSAAMLDADLRARIAGEVRFDAGARALYATGGGGNYRQVPIGVVVPKSVDDVIAAVETAREHDAPVLPRGGGTSLAGQICNVAVIVDCSKYLRGLVELDVAARTARVQPGIVPDALRAAPEGHGLTFRPDPATHARCTLGGMIGSDACGVRSVIA